MKNASALRGSLHPFIVLGDLWQSRKSHF